MSALRATAGIRQGMSKVYRFTLQIPAWVTTSAIERVEPAIKGSRAPSALVVNRSTIAECRMRSPEPASVTM
jgi:hypothetical protein